MLHIAAAKGQVSALKALLAKGADPASPNCELVTPLHLAAATGNLEAVQLLLDSAGERSAQIVQAANKVQFAGWAYWQQWVAAVGGTAWCLAFPWRCMLCCVAGEPWLFHSPAHASKCRPASRLCTGQRPRATPKWSRRCCRRVAMCQPVTVRRARLSTWRRCTARCTPLRRCWPQAPGGLPERACQPMPMLAFHPAIQVAGQPRVQDLAT